MRLHGDQDGESAAVCVTTQLNEDPAMQQIGRVSPAGLGAAVHRCPLAALATLVLLAAPVRAQVQDAAFLGLNSNSNHGWSVALSGDTAAVGAPGAHTNSEGYVYVYRKLASVWTETQLLAGSTSDKTDWFGYAVASDGDVIAVGDWGESDGVSGQPGFHRGAAYVFRRSFAASLFVEEERVQPADLLEHDRFGSAIAIDADVLVVSARGADDAGTESGAAYVFRYDGAAWSQEARLVAPAGAAHDRYGYALSVSGDTLAVGAESADIAATDAGAVFVYQFDGATWALQATLTSEAAVRDDRFGTALDCQGDTLAVGVPRRDVLGKVNAGVVEVFRRNSGLWTLEDTLAIETPAVLDNLGTSVALNDDRLLVGIPNHDGAGPQSGGAALFLREFGVWLPAIEIFAAPLDNSDQLGRSVAIDGDLAVLGAPKVLQNLKRGRVHLYSGVPGAGP
jgi:hypothetical protein